MSPIPALRKHISPWVKNKTGDNLSLYIDRLSEAVAIQGEQKDESTKKSCLQHRVTFSPHPDRLLSAYQLAFQKWCTAWQSQPDTDLIKIETLSPMIIGSGNANLHEAGVQLLRPWGTPYITGTAIKGAISNWLTRQGGDEWNKTTREKSYQQVDLFGGTLDGQSYAGSVTFGDAWWIPSSGTRWFKEDIITPHHSKYYHNSGLPHGMDDPIPHTMSTLAPGLEFMLVIQGSVQQRNELASHLSNMFKAQGIGAKTSVGYGRCKLHRSQREILDTLQNATTADDIECILASESIEAESALITALNAAIQRLDITSISRDTHQHCTDWINKHMPFKRFLLQVIQKQPDSLKTMGALRDQPFKKAVNDANPTDPDVRAIFEYCMKLAIKENRGIMDSWFEKLAYGWDDLSPDMDTLLEIIDNTEWVWPQKSKLPAHIQSRTDLDPGDKNELLEMLEDTNQ